MTLRRWRVLAAAVLLMFAFAMPVFAQTYTGRIDVTVVDATGARLPGVAVDITGPLNQSMVTDARGEAHFLNLMVGNYQVKAVMQGFNEYRNTNVAVVATATVPLEIKMTVAGTKETVQVTAEAPVIDTKKQGTATSVTLEELQNVPTARDPWVVMQSVQGVVMDRVNVGGSESGQQSNYMSKGATGGQTTWNVDGMPITDMSSLSSPFYFDFDEFQEMSVTTGGADTKSATGGIQLNMMLKSGTNTYHGNAKSYFEDPNSVGWSQSNNMPASLAQQLNSATGQGDRTALFKDVGGDLGGPIIKDRLWFWGAYGDQDIRIIKINGTTDRTVLKNASFKVQGQLTNNLRGSFTYLYANKLKWGRNASAFVSQPSTVDQSGPSDLYKGELNWVFHNNLFIVGRYAYVKSGFQLIPEGGSSTPMWWDANGVQRGSGNTYITNRPQQAFVMDGNYFKGRHELKFGFTWRTSDVHSTSTYGTDIVTDAYGAQLGYPIFLANGTQASGYPYMVAGVWAPYAADGNAKYINAYAGDTISLSRATINLGVRFDREAASILPSVEAAPAGLSGILPSITAPGASNALVYNIFEPRVGLTYAVDEARKTQLRASYSLFTNQIGTGEATFLSVAQYRGFYVSAYDANGDHIAQPNELIMGSYPYYVADGDYYGYNATNPGAAATSINRVGNYGVPKTHEIIVGIDHELMPNFGISASFTWRRMMNFNWRPYMNATDTGVIDGTDYTLQGTVTGTLPSGIPGSPSGSYSVPYYAPSPGVTWDPSKGTMYETRPDYHQSYKGLEITATKRMSNHWMARFGFSTNSWREYFASPAGQRDPTPTLTNPNVNGGVVMYSTSGSGKSSIYMTQPKYQFNANGAYQLPYDIDIGGSYILRQGYSMPWNYATSGGFHDGLGGSTKTLLLPSTFDWARLPAINEVDARVGKRFRFAKTAAVNLDLDIFNLFNAGTVLGREYRRTAGAYTNVAEIMQPRIMRLGLRITF